MTLKKKSGYQISYIPN